MPSPTFEYCEFFAKQRNCVLDKVRRTCDNERTNYSLYSNTHFVGGDFRTLNEVIEALTFDPCFKKDPAG